MDRTVEMNHSEEPGVLDTYALVYAFVLLFLLPGMVLLGRLPFGDDRGGFTYTAGYVSLVTVPFLLGLVLTFLTDSSDSARKVAVRMLVLIPLVVFTGVTVLFTASMIMIPASTLLGIRGQGLSLLFWGALAVVALPLVPALVRRLRRLGDLKSAFQAFSIASAIALVAFLVVFTFVTGGDYTEIARKDIVIYVVGALTWYLPSFGIAAGFWRRSGLV